MNLFNSIETRIDTISIGIQSPYNYAQSDLISRIGVHMMHIIRYLLDSIYGRLVTLHKGERDRSTP